MIGTVEWFDPFLAPCYEGEPPLCWASPAHSGSMQQCPLNDCGYQWLLVQEHTVELPDGGSLERPHLPHRLRCTSSGGDTAEIVAVVKTQGSDTKLVGQMQPLSGA